MLTLGRIDIRDERGTTLVELMVGLMMGMLILSALTTVIIVTIHGAARVSARVEATQNGRLALARVTEELHSSCVYPKLAPIKSQATKESTGTTLRFVHAANGQGQAAVPTPILSVLSLSGGILTQSDYPVASGSAPNWTFSTTASSTQQLMTKVAPIPPSSAIFTYYAYESGQLVQLPASPLSETNAARTIQVQVAINTSPRTSPVKDAGADSSIQDSAALRLTPPSFNENATALPCQ